MKAIAWGPGLVVGIPLIDQQHEELIGRLNALARAISGGEGETEIQRTLGFLMEYVKCHFAAEEGIMEAAGYPELPEHKCQHQEFVRTLDRLEEEFREEGSTKILAESLNTLLVNWLLAHIGKVDPQFARHSCRAAGSGG